MTGDLRSFWMSSSEMKRNRKRQLVAHGIWSSSDYWRTEDSSDISRDIWKFLGYLNMYLFSPGFLVKPLEMCCGNVVGERCV
jgi:hypothetical protein